MLLLPFDSARFMIFFLHSNAEDLGRCRWFLMFLREQFQVHVCAVEYPGYGVCPGNASKEAVMTNVNAAMNFILDGLKLPLNRVKVMGRSIGCGPAVLLAAKYRVAGLVLISPFSSVRNLVREKVGVLASSMVEEWFDNEKHIEQVDSPVMIVHGQKDYLVPCSHGEVLYNLLLSRKIFVNPADMEHNTNLTTDISYLTIPMFRFFSLPDYSFDTLKVPQWAFDKRSSALYVRPAMEVCSRQTPTQSRVDEEGAVVPIPGGDQGTEEEPLFHEVVSPDIVLGALQKEAKHGIEGFIEAKGDDGAVHTSHVSRDVCLLIQSTVRTSVGPVTKERYKFGSPMDYGQDMFTQDCIIDLDERGGWENVPPRKPHSSDLRLGFGGQSSKKDESKPL